MAREYEQAAYKRKKTEKANMHGRDFQFTENQRNEKYKNGFLPL